MKEEDLLKEIQVQRTRRLRNITALRIATYFAKIGNIPTEREYLYLTETPLRLAQIKKLYGSYTHMLQEVNLLLNKVATKAAKPEKESQDIGALLQQAKEKAATKAATAEME